MPKSSSAIRTPISDSSRSSRTRAALAVISAVSVISRCSRSGRRPDSTRARVTSSATPGRASWLGEALTATQPRALSRPPPPEPASSQACDSIHQPSGRIRPLLSASSRNVRRREQPELGVLPADQGLVADDRQVRRA